MYYVEKLNAFKKIQDDIEKKNIIHNEDLQFFLQYFPSKLLFIYFIGVCSYATI